jgi:hypothetical protein
MRWLEPKRMPDVPIEADAVHSLSWTGVVMMKTNDDDE